MNNDNDLNLDSMTKLLGWLGHCLKKNVLLRGKIFTYLLLSFLVIVFVPYASANMAKILSIHASFPAAKLASECHQWRSHPDIWSCKFFSVYRPCKDQFLKK